MSTYLYLQCLDHDPPLRSDGEVGQHTYDLPTIRNYIKQRNALAQEYMEMVWPQANTAEGQWRRSAAAFFAEHKWCSIGIIDEYGLKWPIESPEDRIGKVFVDYVGNRWWLDGGGKVLTCAPLNSDGTVDIENAGLPVNGTDNLWVYLRTFLLQATEEQPSW